MAVDLIDFGGPAKSGACEILCVTPLTLSFAKSEVDLYGFDLFWWAHLRQRTAPSGLMLLAVILCS
jgi:hypothetical protein